MGLGCAVFSTEPLRSTTIIGRAADTLALQHTTTAGTLLSRALHQPPLSVAWRPRDPHPSGEHRGDLSWTLRFAATVCNAALTCENIENPLVSAPQYYSKNLCDYY